MPKLVLTNGPEKRIIPLGESAITIGRDPENSITIEGADVSRKHCRIEPDGPHWKVTDLNSKNGTYLNGRAITGPTPLRLADRLTVGDAVLTVLSEEEPVSALTPAIPLAILDSRQLHEPGSGGWVMPRAGVSDPFAFGSDEEDASTDLDSSADRMGAGSAPEQELRRTRGFLKDRLLRLNLLSQAITSELDLDRLLDAILDAMLDFTGFERGLLLLVDETGELKPVLARNLDHARLEGSEQLFSKKVIDLALKRRDATLVRELAGEGMAFDPKASWAQLGLKSALVIPLVAPLRGRPRATQNVDRRRQKMPARLLGALYLDSKKDVRPFDAKDRRLLRTVGAQAAIALQNARLHQQATTDPLTQIANRGFFEQLLQDELKRAQDEGSPVALLLLDLDRFKSVNDRYGHQTGDVVLKETARRIRDAIRRDDVAGRYGGEEFVILLPGAGIEAALTVAGKIRNAVKSSPIGEHQVPVTVSIGIAVFPDHGRDPASLGKRADQALYAAKHSGRDRAEVWRAALDKAGHRMDALAGIVSGDAARDARNLKALLEVVTLSRAPLEATQYFERVLEKVVELTRGERAILFLGDDPEKVEIAACSSRTGVPSQVAYSTSSVRNTLNDKRAVCVLDATEGEWKAGGPSASIESLRLKTVMCVPLTANERVLGAIYVDDKAARREFTQSDLVTFEALAAQLSLAIAFDPRFQKGTGDELARLRSEITKLKDENERLRSAVPSEHSTRTKNIPTSSSPDFRPAPG